MVTTCENDSPTKAVYLGHVFYGEVKVVGQYNHRPLILMKDFHPPCPIGKFPSGKAHFLVYVCYKSFSRICNIERIAILNFV